ncbi:MAG: hypothetical protein AB9869_02215 [Verrucomicrobiia bacterium]
MNATAPKLFRLAMDPRTPEGEAIAALRCMRSQAHTDWLAVAKAVIAEHPITGSETITWDDLRMQFGQHKGCTLSWIAQHNYSYLHWLATEARIGAYLRQQIELVIRAYAK